MKQRGLGLGRWLILVFSIVFALPLINELHQFCEAINTPAPPAKVLAASDSYDNPFILKPFKQK